MAELDTHRRADLLGYLRKQDQSILTTTDLSMFPKGFAEQAPVWKVRLGILEKDTKIV
jgi:recombinational DNA repair ATPase RecF